MKRGIKFGFGFAIGVTLFMMCDAFAGKAVDNRLKKLYAKYIKEAAAE